MPDNALYLYKVTRRYLKGFRSFSADTISLLIFVKRRNSITNIGGITALVLCTPSDSALNLSFKFQKISQRVIQSSFSYLILSKI